MVTFIQLHSKFRLDELLDLEVELMKVRLDDVLQAQQLIGWYSQRARRSSFQ